MKTHDFKVGDKVIINPDVLEGGDMPILNGNCITMLEDMRNYGVYTVKEITCIGCIRLSNGFGYGPTGLLHIPMYELGDYVMISKEGPYKGVVGIIGSVKPLDYAPDNLGEDGCLYKIKSDKGTFNCRNTYFELIASTNKLIYQQENENQLQRKEVAVSRGDKLTGSSICCRRCKASITVGHLSYKEISGS